MRCDNIVSYEFLWIGRTYNKLYCNSYHRVLFRTSPIGFRVMVWNRFGVWLVVGSAYKDLVFHATVVSRILYASSMGIMSVF